MGPAEEPLALQIVYQAHRPSSEKPSLSLTLSRRPDEKQINFIKIKDPIHQTFLITLIEKFERKHTL